MAQINNADFFASHEVNAELAKQVADAATAKGLGVSHNRTSYAHFDGYHRYILFASTNPSRNTYNNKDVVEYYADRYAHYFKPSISGEAQSMRLLLKAISSYK